MMKNKLLAVLVASVLAAACSSGGGSSSGGGTSSGSSSSGSSSGMGEDSSVEVAVDSIFMEANDFRGLSYAKVGDNAAKIYASGHVGTDDASRQVVVARFLADGTPDTSFGGTGFVTLEATAEEGVNDETSLGVAELASGDVVVAANAIDAAGSLSIYLFRLNADGTQVAGWGDDAGKVEVPFGYANADDATFPGTAPMDFVWDLQVDPSVTEDRVVVFGNGSANDGVRTDVDRYIARMVITDTGANVDSSFNGGEAFSYGVGEFADNQRRGIVQEDGKIVAAGYTNLGEGIRHHVMLIRLNVDGTFDDTFAGYSTIPELVPATPGLTAFNPYRVDGGFAEAYAVGIQESTSSYVTAGYGGVTGFEVPSTLGYESSIAQDIVAFRTSTGTSASEDMGWGNNGEVAVLSEGLMGYPTNEDRGRHMVVVPDGRTVIVGRFGGVPAAVVLTEDGQPDTSVFGSGRVELPSDVVTSQFYAAATSPDGTEVAMTTDANVNGVRLVVLKVSDGN